MNVRAGYRYVFIIVHLFILLITQSAANKSPDSTKKSTTYNIPSVSRTHQDTTTKTPPLVPPEIVSFTSSADSCSINDTILWIVSYRVSTVPIQKIHWNVAGMRTNIEHARKIGQSGSDTLHWAWDTKGTKGITVFITDSTGDTIKRSSKVLVYQDIPRMTLTSDTAVGLNDPIHLKITAYDKFGTIVKKGLSVGGSPFFRTSQTDTVITSPPQPSERFLCIYRITDDDGNEVCDSVSVRIFSSPPKVQLEGDTMVGLFQPIRLKARTEDNGSIASYAWDIGGTEKFVTAGSTDTILPNYNRPINRLPCIFRATDEDGEIGLDTIFVNSSLFWHPVQPTNSLPERSGYGVVVHNGKMWIIGGDKPDVWNSSDGQNWELITDSAAFGPRYGHTTVSFRNRLWIIGGKVNTTTFAKGIWSSNDGRTWTLEADSSFMHRQYHTAKVFRDRLWVIGGINASDNEPCLHDIWSSPDGKQWELVSDSSGFPRRYGHGTVVFDNKLWVIGGLYDGMNSSAHLHDTWYSTDGKDWHKASDSTYFAKNIIYSYITFDNKLWAIGGYSDDGSRGFTDVWFSENGKRWIRATDSPSVTQHYATTAFIFRNRIWMSVGTDPSLWYCN